MNFAQISAMVFVASLASTPAAFAQKSAPHVTALEQFLKALEFSQVLCKTNKAPDYRFLIRRRGAELSVSQSVGPAPVISGSAYLNETAQEVVVGIAGEIRLSYRSLAGNYGVSVILDLRNAQPDGRGGRVFAGFLRIGDTAQTPNLPLTCTL